MPTNLLLTATLFSCNKLQHIRSFLFLSYLMLLGEITHTLSNLDDQICGLRKMLSCTTKVNVFLVLVCVGGVCVSVCVVSNTKHSFNSQSESVL